MKIKTAIIVLAISFFSFNSLLRPGYIPMHDDMQPIRLQQLDKCFDDGQIPCRWVPDLGYGYGYPQFIFYSPFAYYLMEVFHLIGFSILTSVKIGFILSFIFSAFSMYLLGSALWGRLGGYVSSAFYLYAPYRAADVYSRGAVGEFWALGFLPLILWAIYVFFTQKYSRKNSLVLAISLAGLLITHNLTTIAFAPVAVIWAAILLIYYRAWSLLPKFFQSLISGLLLSAFYTIPLFFEQSQVHLDSMISGYFNYLAHFTSLYQLFFRGHWGFGSSELGPYDDLSFSIGTIHWLILLVSILIFIKTKYYLQKNPLRPLFIFFLLLFMASIFMTHPRSSFIWQMIDPLKYFQFPWRFLILTMLATSVLAGFPIYLLKNSPVKATIYSILLIIVVIAGNSFLFRPSRYIAITDAEKLSGTNLEHQLTASIFDYLPIYAKAPPASSAPKSPQVLSGTSQITNYQRGTDWQSGTITTQSSQSTVQLPLFYYPGFRVLIDGQPTTISHDNDLGLITFNTTYGNHQFDVKLTRTPDRLAGDILTILGMISLFLI